MFLLYNSFVFIGFVKWTIILSEKEVNKITNIIKIAPINWRYENLSLRNIKENNEAKIGSPMNIRTVELEPTTFWYFTWTKLTKTVAIIDVYNVVAIIVLVKLQLELNERSKLITAAKRNW